MYISYDRPTAVSSTQSTIPLVDKLLLLSYTLFYFRFINEDECMD